MLPFYMMAQIQDSYGDNYLSAAFLGNLDEIKKLIEVDKVPINYASSDGKTAIMYAAMNGQDEIIKYLLNKKNDIIDLEDDDKNSALFYAILNYNEKTAELLIRKGANVNHKNKYGYSPLHIAVLQNRNLMTDMLLYYDADPNIKDKNDCTPIYYAVENKYYSIIEILLSKGAKVNISQKDSTNLLHTAASNNNKNFLEKYKDSIENVQDKRGLYPIDYAVIEGHNDVLNWFLNNNYKLRDTILGIYAPLTLAKYSNNKETKKTVKHINKTQYHFLFYQQVGIGYFIKFNKDDFLMAPTLLLKESRYGFVFECGFMFRNKDRIIYEEKAANVFYQLRESRKSLFVSAEKHFKIFAFDNSYISLFPKISAYYQFGKYDGYADKITQEIIIGKAIGLQINFSRIIAFDFYCEHLKMPINFTSSFFYAISTKMFINYRTEAVNEKYKYINNY